MSEEQLKSFDFAADIIKQLVTLSTAILTAFVALKSDIVEGLDHRGETLILWSIGLQIASILVGIVGYQNLTGNLSRPAAGTMPTIYRPSIQIMVIAQLVLFFSALVLMFLSALYTENRDDQKNTYRFEISIGPTK